MKTTAQSWLVHRLTSSPFVLGLLVAGALAILSLTSLIRVSHVMALAFCQGCIDSLDMTVRQTLQMDLVGPEELQSSVSLNSAAFSSARMVGPLVAGIWIAWLGEGPCLALNALSYLAVRISLFTIRVKPARPSGDRDSILEQISTGMRFGWKAPSVRRVLVAVALTSAVGFPSTP